MSPVFTSASRAKIELHLHAEVDGVPSPFRCMQTFLTRSGRALEPKKFVLAENFSEVRRKAKKLTRKEKTASVHEKVSERANGFCECGCGISLTAFWPYRGEMDQFHWGQNKRALESVEGVLDARALLP